MEPVKTLSFHDLRNTDFPPDNFLIGDGLLPRNGLMFVAGPPKSYKSFLTGTIIYHLVTGTNLFGAHRSQHGRAEQVFSVAEPQRVLFLEQEIGYFDVRERLLPLWSQLMPPAQELLDHNLFIHSRDHTMRLDKSDGVKTIGKIIEDTKPTVVCFDPLIEFHGADENDAQQMTSVLRNLDLLRNTYKFATIITHHTGKPDPAKLRSGPDLMRGSSAIFGKGDAFILLTIVNRDAGCVRLDFTIRRGKPLDFMTVFLDWQSLRAKFHKWGKAHTNGHVATQ